AGRVVFFEFALRQPVITLVQHRSGRLNIEELLRLGGPDSGHGPHGPATLILFRNVQIEDGTLTLRLQAQRAEPGDTALEIQGGGPNGRVRVRRFEHLDARLAALQVSSPVERGIGIVISRLAVESSDPAAPPCPAASLRCPPAPRGSWRCGTPISPLKTSTSSSLARSLIRCRSRAD